MVKKINKLTVQKINSLNKKGYYSDGNGLYLQVSKTGGKSWIYRYTYKGNSHEMGLGSYSKISLKKARTLVQECKNQNDPLNNRKSTDNNVTFEECFKQFKVNKVDILKNEKNKQQWENTLKKYAYPTIGNKNVADINVDMIEAILTPIWKKIPETARRVRSRIKKILDYAITKKYRTDSNPAIWEGNLEMLLDARRKEHKHFCRLEHEHVPLFIKKLRAKNSMSAKALEFLILTATRSNETREATWSEINFKEKKWVIPSDRMKVDKNGSHEIPLSEEAITLLSSIKGNRKNNDFIFFTPNYSIKNKNGFISDSIILRLAKKIASENNLDQNITVHGFRSSFREWGAKETQYSSDVLEFCLAHQIKNQVERAYQRSTLYEKRIEVMNDWAEYCYSKINTD